MKNITYDVFELQIRSSIETRVIAFSTCKRVQGTVACEKQGYETTCSRDLWGTRRRRKGVRGKSKRKVRRNGVLSEFFRLPRITFHVLNCVWEIITQLRKRVSFVQSLGGTIEVPFFYGKSISINRDAARTRPKVITHASIGEI